MCCVSKPERTKCQTWTPNFVLCDSFKISGRDWRDVCEIEILQLLASTLFDEALRGIKVWVSKRTAALSYNSAYINHANDSEIQH